MPPDGCCCRTGVRATRPRRERRAEPEAQPRALDWLGLATTVLAVSWAAPLIRIADAPSTVQAGLRLAIAAPLVLLPAVALRRVELRTLAGRELLLLAASGLVLAAHYLAWIASVQRTSVITSTVLVTLTPLLVALAARVALRERPSRSLLAGLAVATAGALLLAGDDLQDRGSLGGDSLALAGALLAAAYLVLGRYVRRRLSTLAQVAVVYPVAAAALLLALAASGDPVRGHPPHTYVAIALLALVPQLLGGTALNFALGALPAAVVSVALLGEPVGATIIAATLLGEAPTLLEWLGAGIVLAGVAIALAGSALGER